MPPQAFTTTTLATRTPSGSTASTSTETSLLPWYSTPVNNSVQFLADMVIFACMICLTLFLFCSILYNGGSVFAKKTLLLFCVLVTMSGYQYCAAQEVGLATTPIPIISYIKYSFLALTEGSFLLYNWSRSYPIILAEVSPRLIAVAIPKEKGSSLLGLVDSILCVLVNLFFLIGCWALVTMKYRLDTLSMQDTFAGPASDAPSGSAQKSASRKSTQPPFPQGELHGNSEMPSPLYVGVVKMTKAPNSIRSGVRSSRLDHPPVV
ncbi:hypothetical protein BC830DRAFT_1115687 [Chytriomyces sp. MP71]|nr:hypothetical protein BC830DRAFT_1115687 [Chytriomyces sp. MP71]